MVVKVAALVRTNVAGTSIGRDFPNKLTNELVKQFYTQIQHVTVDVQPNCLMVRGGSSVPMAVVQLYHNDDRCDDRTKVQYAERLAAFIAHRIDIDECRCVRA
ncbi:hypothetical protein ACOMHN_067407 [Nucella lapillus]